MLSPKEFLNGNAIVNTDEQESTWQFGSVLTCPTGRVLLDLGEAVFGDVARADRLPTPAVAGEPEVAGSARLPRQEQRQTWS